MIADSWRHVERDYDLDSLHCSHSRRSETGRLGECCSAPAIGRVQTQRSAAEIEQPRSIVLGWPLLDLAGLEIRFNLGAARDGHVVASRAVQTVLAVVIPTETTWPTANPFRDPK